MSIAPVAANNNMAIVLSSPNDGIKVFEKFIDDRKIEKSYILGKEMAISTDIESKLPNPQRIGGEDRIETNLEIIKTFYKGNDLNNLFIAKDGMRDKSDLVDALTVGVLAAKEQSPILVVGNNLEKKQQDLLLCKNPMQLTKVGGNGNENAFKQLISIFKR